MQKICGRVLISIVIYLSLIKISDNNNDNIKIDEFNLSIKTLFWLYTQSFYFLYQPFSKHLDY